MFHSMLLPCTSLYAHQIVLTDAVWVSPNLLRVPFTLTGSLITIDARADSLEGKFFFDTGASSFILNAHWFGQAKRKTVKAEVAGGINGKVEVLGATTIDTVKLQSMRIIHAPADLVDLSHLEQARRMAIFGILGYATFEPYEVLFDYENLYLLLIRTEASGARLAAIPNWEYQVLDSTEIRVKGHIAQVALQFNNKKKWFGLDSGAEQNMLDKLVSGGFLKAHFVVQRRIKLKGVDNSTVEVIAGVLQGGSVNGISLAPMPTLLSTLSGINEIYRTSLDGILGYPFLSQMPMSVNYKRQMLYFYKVGTGP
jgi:hypothetical protein